MHNFLGFAVIEYMKQCKRSINYDARSLWDISLLNYLLFFSLFPFVSSQLNRHTHFTSRKCHQTSDLYGITGLDLFRIPLQNPIIRAHFTLMMMIHQIYGVNMQIMSSSQKYLNSKLTKLTKLLTINKLFKFMWHH